MNFTPEQHRAIYTHDRSLIVVAGAGSGKTRVLVERYLALLEHNPDWSLNALVAITFTQKAAQEMRDRVRDALQQRLAAADTPDAQARWSNLLATMDSARIDTIHAMCATLLRANAAEAGIDPHFAIIEPVDADALLQDVIDRALNDLLWQGESDPVAALFAAYEADSVRKTLADFVATPLPSLPDDPAEIVVQWQSLWQANAAHHITSALKGVVITNFQDWWATTAAPKSDKLTDTCAAFEAELKAIDGFPAACTLNEALATLHRLAKTSAGTRGSPAAWGGKENRQEAAAFVNSVRDWARQVLAIIGDPPGELDEQAAQLLLLWVTLVRRVQASYIRVKAAEDLLDFEDLERRTLDLLTQSPGVKQRYLGAEFRHVLVDEFQDTNARQWRIVQALTDPEQPVHGEPARLFVVGDPKQSIYGFRGADVSVFEQVRRTLAAIPTSDGTASEIPLTQSFRTHAPLIGAFNHIFGQLLSRTPGSIVSDYEVEYGEPMSAYRSTPPDDTPPLQLMLINQEARPPSDIEDSGDHSKQPAGKMSTDEGREWEAAELAVRIRQMVFDKPLMIYDKEADQHRAITLDDIAILFQTMSNVAIYEEGLRAQNISYITVAGRGYYSRQEVWDLLALLESLYNPFDDLALATALRSPLFTFSDETLFALRLFHDSAGKPLTLWEALRIAATRDMGFVPQAEHERVRQAWHTLQALHRQAGRVTISELLRDALARTGYLATLMGLPDGARRRANVEKLLKKAVESNRATLSDFTAYLSDLSDREVRESEAETDVSNAVRLMTVHASKGLEFPMVILPDASWSNNASNNSSLLNYAGYGVVCSIPGDDGKSAKPYLYEQIKKTQKQRDEAERKRLLYVAATRAQDYLLVSGQASWNSEIDGWKSRGLWLNWLLDALDLRDYDGEEDTIDYEWGQLHVYRPLHRMASSKPTQSVDDKLPLWEQRPVLDGQPLAGPTTAPPLTQPVPAQLDRYAKNLTATQIADLGSAPHHPFYLERFRCSVLQDTPTRVKQVIMPDKSQPNVTPRVLGEIVHEALRWWRFPDKTHDMHHELVSYAWKHGVVQPEDLKYAVNTARGWLRDMQYTDIYRMINRAQRVYRELPCVYQTDKRVIHGMIDVLFQQPDGTWAIVDYKSSLVKGYVERTDDATERANRMLLAKHAERYYLQVGIYATAVERYLADLGGALEPNQLAIYIHYLRYGQAVPVKHEQWSAALSQLEIQIGHLIEEDET